MTLSNGEAGVGKTRLMDVRRRSHTETEQLPADLAVWPY